MKTQDWGGFNPATSVAVASGLIIQISFLVSGPLLARMLGTDERGQLAVLIVWPLAIGQLGSLGWPQAMAFTIASGTATKRAVVYSLRWWILTQIALLIAIHIAVMTMLLKEEQGWLSLVGASLVIVPIYFAQWYGGALLQGQGHFVTVTVLRAAAAFIYALVALALFILGLGGVLEIILAWIGANIVVGVISLTIAFKGEDMLSDGAVADRGQLFKFGIKSHVGNIDPIENLKLDQILVSLIFPPAALGLYAVALAFTNLPRFIAQNIGQVALGRIASERKQEARKLTWNFLVATMAVGLCIVLPLLVLVGWLIPFFFGQEFEGAVLLARILLLGAFFSSARRTLSDCLGGADNPEAGSLAQVAGLIWTLPALVILTATLDVKGVAIAVSSAQAVSFAVLLLMFLSSQLRPTPVSTHSEALR